MKRGLFLPLSLVRHRLKGRLKRQGGFMTTFLQQRQTCSLPLSGVTVSYSGLTLNQYGVASPCRTICTVCGFVALS